MERIADYIINKLSSEGTNHIFMVTGRGVLYLSDAIAKNPHVEGVSVHHEQSGAFAAYAYSQKKGTFGACLVSTGVASTNAITGVLNAWQDGVPVIFISGQNMLSETTYHTGLNIRTFGQQEANIVELVRPITKYAVMLEDAKSAAYEIDKAFFMANSGRKGPVWIDIPLDIQNMRIEPEEVAHFTGTDVKAPLAIEDAKYIESCLIASERPILLVGSGVRAAKAELHLRDFIRKWNIPVVFDSAATDIFPDENRLSIGTIGSLGGSRAGNFAIQNSDLILSVGCRLSSMQVGEEPNHFGREARIIAVDIDDNEKDKQTVKLNRYIHADAGETLVSLVSTNCEKDFSDWVQKCIHWKTIWPKCEEWCKESGKIDIYHLADCIGNNLKPMQTVTCDAGIEELAVPPTVCKTNGVHCIHPASQGCMGFALGASIGASLAGEEEVYSIIGDGSVMMNLQELQTIAYNLLPIKVFIVNNNCYAVIRKRQADLFRNRTIGTDAQNGVSCADFEKISSAFGLPYYRLEANETLEQDLEPIYKADGPLICEVIAKEDQEYLRNAYGKNSRNRLVRRSLEDQAPFMDRQLFQAEMVIQTMDE